MAAHAIHCVVSSLFDIYFKVIFAQLSPVAIFPVLPRATKDTGALKIFLKSDVYLADGH
jgi:hypothetical protein